MGQEHRVLNWSPDIPDFRDAHYVPPPTLLAVRPPIVDLRSTMSPVEDQGDIGSCTAQAISGAIEHLPLLKAQKFWDVSRLFIYYNERMLEGTTQVDAGAFIRDGIKACAKIGFCKELYWPYNTSKFAVRPANIAYADASKNKIKEYARCTTFEMCLNALSSGFPVIFGFSVYPAFVGDEVERTGILPMPQLADKLLGGHAVLMVGYNDTTRQVLVRNSWGSTWGQKGYFTMPYEYVSNPDLCDDFWVIKR